MRSAPKPSITRRSWITGTAAASLAAQPSGQPVRLPRKIRVAFLGLDGHTSEILRPLPQLPDVDVVAVSDPDPKATARVIRNPRLAAASQYAHYRRMLASEELDLVAVCNPNGERAAAILACLERKLHVVAEKPLATARQDLERIKEAVTKQGTRLGMLLPMRFSSPYLAAKKVVDAGEIGEVAQISSQKSYKAGDRPAWMRKRATYGSTILWIGIHMIDLMRWASGREFTEAFSIQSKLGLPQVGEMETTTGSVFRLDNGGVATLHMDYYRPETAPTHGDDRLRLAGPLGVVEYQTATGVTVLTAKSQPRTITDLPPGQSLFVDFLEFVYLGKPTSLPLSDIYRVTEITIAAHEAAERRRTVSI